MPQSDAVASIGAWMLEHGHRAILAVTGGRWPKKVAGMQTLELQVVGRKSGQKRSTLLTAPICEDDRVVIVASKGGHSDDPQWYKNLVVNPDVEITIDGQTRPGRHRARSGMSSGRRSPARSRTTPATRRTPTVRSRSSSASRREEARAPLTDAMCGNRLPRKRPRCRFE